MSGFIEFRDNDAGYLAWLAAHRDGYVINIARGHNPTQARLHGAGCRTISGQNPRGGPWTGPYVKVCAEDVAELDRWAVHKVGQPISPCGTCRPAGSCGPPASTKRIERADGLTDVSGDDDPAIGSSPGDHCIGRAASAEPTDQAVTASRPRGQFDIRGPAMDSPVIEAWADDYIRFERRPVWQEELRHEIRRRCGRLTPSAGQVLHAAFLGPKLPNADVENLTLYNIDSFRSAGRNGVRFEHGAVVPPAPDGAQYGFGYRYALASISDTFAHRRLGRTLASFDWIDLGASVGEKKDCTKLSSVWLALARAREQIESTGPGSGAAKPFVVRVKIRPGAGRQPVWGGLVKGIFDGVISAFQAHTDMTGVPEVTARLAASLQADRTEIEKHLIEKRWAVLGAVPRLVSPYRDGVKWDPADHLCVAGELIAADPVGPCWSIKGDLIAVAR